MKRKQDKGSFTVEMTLLFPAIFFIILGVLNLCIIHYENVVLSATAMRAASRVAAYWEYADDANAAIFKDVPAAQMISADTKRAHDPYRYLFEKTSVKESGGKIYTQNLVDNLPVLLQGHESRTMKELKKSGGLFHTESGQPGNLMQTFVCVTVEKKDMVPLRSAFEQYGVHIGESSTVTAKARLNNPGEFVRNTAFFYDLVTGLGDKEE